MCSFSVGFVATSDRAGTLYNNSVGQWTGWIPISVDQLSATFAALANPTRRAILARLTDGEATVNELAASLPITGQAVSRHLQVLEQAGLIERGRRAQLRPSRLCGAPLKDATEWLEAYRRFWEVSFDRLDQRLRASENRAEDG